MKLLKSTLLIIAACMIQQVSAKPLTGARRTTTPSTPVVTPTPSGGPSAPSKTSFQYILNRIRNNMASEFIINDQGVFGSKFQDMIQSSGLAPELMEALMQAGRNLHLPLSGDNNQDLATIDYAQDNINRFITQHAAASTPEEVTPEFYNSRTNLFNQDYLDEYVTSKNVTQQLQKNAEKAIIDELMPKITEAWEKRGIPRTPSQIDAAERQIIRTIDKEFRKVAKPRAPQRPTAQKPVDITPTFYNTRTNLFHQDYLDKYISSKAYLTSMPQNDAERMVIGELMPEITDVWKKRNIPMSIAQVDAARGQIIRTIEKEFRKWGKPQVAVRQNPEEIEEKIILPMPPIQKPIDVIGQDQKQAIVNEVFPQASADNLKPTENAPAVIVKAAQTMISQNYDQATIINAIVSNLVLNKPAQVRTTHKEIEQYVADIVVSNWKKISK